MSADVNVKVGSLKFAIHDSKHERYRCQKEGESRTEVLKDTSIDFFMPSSSKPRKGKLPSSQERAARISRLSPTRGNGVWPPKDTLRDGPAERPGLKGGDGQRSDA